MNINLNSFEKSHLTETVENLQSQFNVPATTMVPVEVVNRIYDALLEAVKVCRINEDTSDYIKTMVRSHDLTERSIEEYVSNLKMTINRSVTGKYPADFALRCLLAVLRNGQMTYPDANRPTYARILGLGKMSDKERANWEEAKLESVARNLVEIVNYYYQSRN